MTNDIHMSILIYFKCHSVLPVDPSLTEYLLQSFLQTQDSVVHENLNGF